MIVSKCRHFFQLCLFFRKFVCHFIKPCFCILYSFLGGINFCLCLFLYGVNFSVRLFLRFIGCFFCRIFGCSINCLCFRFCPLHVFYSLLFFLFTFLLLTSNFIFQSLLFLFSLFLFARHFFCCFPLQLRFLLRRFFRSFLHLFSLFL